MNIPGFTAEISLYNASRHYRAMAGPPNALVNGRGVLPQLRRQITYCSMKGCCVDLRFLGIPRICCNGDECGPDVFI